MIPLLLLLSMGVVYGADTSKVESHTYKWPPSCRLELLRYEDNYALSDGMYEKAIRPELVSSSLRALKAKQLATLLKTGTAYVKIGQYTDGELTMDLMPRTYGGGPGGAFTGGVAGMIIGKGGALLAGYAILYSTKAFIHVTAGREAAQEFDNHIVQVSIPHLNRVAETIGEVFCGVGTIAGAASPLP